MSQSVTIETSWGIVRYLKPFPGFEKVYQGQPAGIPIAFPGTLDQHAAQGLAGYDPNLLAGITVPLGAKITIWIPLTLSSDTVANQYQYQIIWRMRTIEDFVRGQSTGQVSSEQSYSSYHLGMGPYGQAESLLDPATKRFFLPGATRTAVFPQTEPTGGAPAVVHMYGQVIQPLSSPVWVPPLTPSGTTRGAWQQGIYPEPGANETGPSFMVFNFTAEGDEMSILASKINPQEGDLWDFTSGEPGDLAFSETYGDNNGRSSASPFTAILVMTGTG